MKQSFLSLLLMVPVIAGANPTITPSETLNQDGKGCYLIGNAADLYAFAEVVKQTPDACGKLTENIIVNTTLLKDDGLPTNCQSKENCSTKSDEFIEWTPMSSFSGTFDGDGHIISGLYVFITGSNENKAATNVGLFTNSTGGTSEKPAVIKNLGFVNSVVKGYENIGGIFGSVNGVLRIENSYNEATILGSTYIGGFIGLMGVGADVTIENSYNKGKTFIGNSVGGFVGKIAAGYDKTDFSKLKIINSYNIGVIQGYDAYAGIVGLTAGAGGSAEIENSYTTSGGFVGRTENLIPTIIHSFYPKSNVTECGTDGGCPAEFFTDEALKDSLNKYLEEHPEINGGEWVLPEEGGNPTINPNGGSSEPEPEAFVGIEFTFNSGSSTAWLKEGKDLIYLPRDTIVNRVVVERSFTQGTFATLMLPFNVNMSKDTLQVYKFMGVHKESDGTTSKWVAHYSFVENGAMVANQPYLVNPQVDINKYDLDFSADEITLKANTDTIYEQTTGNWTVKGTYKYILWDDAEYDSPHIFGFAASAKEGSYVAGQFVRAASGAYIRPMRFFLDYKAPMNRPGLFKSASFALPETIDIVIDDENGENSMTIGKLNTVTGEVKTDRWFDMKGRKLGAKPTFNGIFQNNGRQVIVK